MWSTVACRRTSEPAPPPNSRRSAAMTRAKDDLHLMVPQRFFTHGQHSQGDRHVYASRTRFIPEKLLGLFERTSWPVVPAGATVRTPSQGPRIDIGARMRGMWR